MLLQFLILSIDTIVNPMCVHMIQRKIIITIPLMPKIIVSLIKFILRLLACSLHPRARVRKSKMQYFEIKIPSALILICNVHPLAQRYARLRNRDKRHASAKAPAIPHYASLLNNAKRGPVPRTPERLTNLRPH